MAKISPYKIDYDFSSGVHDTLWIEAGAEKYPCPTDIPVLDALLRFLCKEHPNGASADGGYAYYSTIKNRGKGWAYKIEPYSGLSVWSVQGYSNRESRTPAQLINAYGKPRSFNTDSIIDQLEKDRLKAKAQEAFRLQDEAYRRAMLFPPPEPKRKKVIELKTLNYKKRI